jgi:4-hydroxybenzoate polyprenyltransferase
MADVRFVMPIDGPPRIAPMPLDFFKLMRPQDWVKSIFILPAIIFSIPGLGPAEWASILPGWMLATFLTIVGFSLLASGFYAVNDSLDVELDRQHPRKQGSVSALSSSSLESSSVSTSIKRSAA